MFGIDFAFGQHVEDGQSGGSAEGRRDQRGERSPKKLTSCDSRRETSVPVVDYKVGVDVLGGHFINATAMCGLDRAE